MADDSESYLVSEYQVNDLDSKEALDLWTALRSEDAEEYESLAEEYDFSLEYPEDEEDREIAARSLQLYNEGLHQGRTRQRDFDTKFISSMLAGNLALNYTGEIGDFLSQRSPDELKPALDAAAEVPELGAGLAAFAIAGAATWKSLDKILDRAPS